MTAPDETTVDPDLVEVVARVLCNDEYTHDIWATLTDDERDVDRPLARKVLAALAEHGALMPTGGEQETELGVSFGVGWGIAPCACNSACNARHTHRRTVTTWPEGHPLAGHTLTSPWRRTDG